MKWDLEHVASATGGTAVGSAIVARVVTDSRLAGPEALFVAVRGERLDGHDFAADAAAAGASVLVEIGRIPPGACGVEVADTMTALAALAISRRDELEVPVVAVTGSSGKTTTKDMIAAALGPSAHCAPRSYNNEIGVPLTVLGTPTEASSLVVEVGSRGAGHIRELGPAIRPDVAVITNIGPAHLEMFGDVDAVRRAKWELVELLDADGVAVLPASDAQLTEARDGPMLTFGQEGSDADVVATDVTLDAMGRASFHLESGGQRHAVTLTVAGRHQALNAAAAAAAALAVGVDLGDAAHRIAGADVSVWRMEVSERPVEGGSVVVVNDAYNANPDSMAAAFTTVAAMPGRRIAVLGKMHELGVAEGRLHREVGELAVRAGFAAVIVVGDDPGLADGAGESARRVPDADAAIAAIDAMIAPGDVVLVKASRASGLEEVAARIAGGDAQ